MVDDNPANLQMLQAILEGQGCRLLTARDGAGALSVAAKEKPDVILLDEPFSRLDADRRAQVRDMVFDRARARALPVLMVTHDAEDAQATGGEIVTLTDRS